MIHKQIHNICNVCEYRHTRAARQAGVQVYRLFPRSSKRVVEWIILVSEFDF